VLALTRRQSRALLYRLAAAAQPVSRDALCYLFWPNTNEATARRNLTVLLNHLRCELPLPNSVLSVGDAIDLRRASTPHPKSSGQPVEE